MSQVTLPLTGGCHCGAVRYELNAPPWFVYACHCTDCQRQSGSAFNMSMPAPREAFRLTSGDPARYPRTLPSGRRSTVRFCGACGTRLFSESSETSVTIRPGTLDDTRWLKPSAQFWTRSAQGWACIEGVPSYEEQSDGFAEPVRAWRKQGVTFVTAEAADRLAPGGEPP